MLSFLANRWLLSVIGLLVLALLIWFIGDEITVFERAPLASRAARAITILVIVLLWAIVQLLKALKTNRASRELADGMAAEDASHAPDRSAEETRHVQQRFEAAMAVLKRAKGRKGRLNLYQLPWYIIIGPPGAGKTTALEYSGLYFPLAEKLGQKLRGVGGTRNCDFWFADEAVLLDTAGRFTTQDSEAETDRSGWQTFLAELKAKRPRRPINGVMVAVSMHDLMTLSQDELSDHAHKIKSRVQELYDRFRIRFPIYVMLTKCDLIAGFTEFFSDLDEEQREQVWGMTFPMEDSDSVTGAMHRFSSEFRVLLERLNDRLLWKLAQESDSQRRAAIYAFPSQLAALGPTIDAFLDGIFRGSHYHEAPMLRGVYFSSGTQEGAPIDRLLGSVAQTFGLDQQALPSFAGSGRSYFIKSFLRDVVFAESEIAGTNRKLEQRRAWLQRAAYAAAAVVVGLAVALWTVSYNNNRAYIDEVRAATARASEAVAGVPPTNRDPVLTLPALDAVRTIPGGYEDRETGRPLLSGFGLSQAATLGGQAQRTYGELLRELLLPRLMLRLERQMRDGGPVPDYRYEALKTYLMLDSRDHYNAAEVLGWLRADVNNLLARRMSDSERESMMAHLQALFSEQPRPLPQALDDALILDTQRIVNDIRIESRIYNRLRQSGLSQDLPRFTVFDAAGPQAQRVFRLDSSALLNDGIDGFFTRQGYLRFFVREGVALSAELVDETWILGPYARTGLDSAQILSDVEALYLDEFSQLYESLLLSLELVSFTTPDEAANILNVLRDPADSPLLLLLQAVAAETNLRPDVAEDIDATAAAAQERLESTIGFEGANLPAPDRSVNSIEERFEWVTNLVAGEGASAPIQHVLSLFDQLYRFMALVSSEVGGQGDLPTSVADQGRAVVDQVLQEARGQPRVIRRLMERAAERSRILALQGVSEFINNEWRSEPLPFCRSYIAGRYPLSANSPQDISLEDFATFFGPNGLMDSFFNAHLAEYVDRSERPWGLRSAAATPIRISEDALRQFWRANVIRETFFRGGGGMPSVAFQLTPLYMDPELSRVTLIFGGSTVNPTSDRVLTYSFEAPTTEYLDWPGLNRYTEVRFELSPPSPGSGSMLRERGPWAWFRMLDSDNTRIGEASSPSTFPLEFDVDGRQVVYELTVNNEFSPFRFPEMEQFSCPDSL